MTLREEDEKHKVTDIAFMIRGFTFFSFTYINLDGDRGYQLVFFNKKVHDFP